MCLPWYLEAFVWVIFIVSKTYTFKLHSCLLISRIQTYLNLKKSFVSYGSGTPALTSRGFLEDDFVKVAELFDASVKLALKIKAASTGKRLLLS